MLKFLPTDETRNLWQSSFVIHIHRKQSIENLYSHSLPSNFFLGISSDSSVLVTLVMRPEYVKELLAPTLNARHLANGRRITGRSWFGRCWWGLVSCLGITLSFLGGEQNVWGENNEFSFFHFHSVRWLVICLSETLALKSRFKAKHGVLKFWSSFVQSGSDRGRLSLEKGLFWTRTMHVNWPNNYVLVFHLETDVAVIIFSWRSKSRNDPSIPTSTPRCPPQYQTDRLAGAPTETYEILYGIGVTPKKSWWFSGEKMHFLLVFESWGRFVGVQFLGNFISIWLYHHGVF